jgi:hypothetical protein
VEITRNGALLYVTGTLPRDILMIPVTGPVGTGRALLDGPASESGPTVSPDGRWLAFWSNENGPDEVYVRPFPDVGAGVWQVSMGGGFHPQWSWDGSELFYLATRGAEIAMMAVPIDSAQSFGARRPVQLFQGPYPYFKDSSSDVYDVSHDGRFLMIKEHQETRREIVIVQNWFEELKRLVPTE